MKQTNSCNTCIFNVMKNVADFLQFVLLLPFYVCYQNNLMYNSIRIHVWIPNRNKLRERQCLSHQSVSVSIRQSFFFFHCVKFHETLCVNIHIARNFVIRAFLMSWRMSLIVFSLPEILISSLGVFFLLLIFFIFFFFGIFWPF